MEASRLALTIPPFFPGDFKNNLTDRLEGLSNEQIASIVEWKHFYFKVCACGEQCKRRQKIERSYTCSHPPTHLFHALPHPPVHSRELAHALLPSDLSARASSSFHSIPPAPTQEYTHKGRVVGSFYTKKGEPKAELAKVSPHACAICGPLGDSPPSGRSTGCLDPPPM